MPANTRYSFEICSNENEKDAIDAYIALRRAVADYVSDSSSEVIGPDAPNAPALAASGEYPDPIYTEITIGNYTPVSGVTYTLFCSDDNFANKTGLGDVTPNAVLYSEYVPGRQYRIEATEPPGKWSAGSRSSLTIP